MNNKIIIIASVARDVNVPFSESKSDTFLYKYSLF